MKTVATEDGDRQEVVDVGGELVRNHIAAALQGCIVGTVDSVQSLECRCCCRTRHSGNFLTLSVNIGSAELEILHRLSLCRECESVAISLVGVGKHVCTLEVLILVIIRKILVVYTVISTGKAVDIASVAVLCKNHLVIKVDVGKAYSVEGLGEHTFCCEGEREVNRNSVICCKGNLGLLRHTEVLVNAHNAVLCTKGHLTVFRSYGSVDAESLGCFFDVGDDLAGSRIVELVDSGNAGCIGFSIGVDGGKVGRSLNHSCTLRHVGEEHQRETALEQTGATANDEALVFHYVPVETYAWRELNAGVGIASGVDVLTTEVKCLDCVVGKDGAVVECKHVGANTVGELEVARYRPLILQISTNLAVCNLSARVRVTVVTDGKAG